MLFLTLNIPNSLFIRRYLTKVFLTFLTENKSTNLIFIISLILFIAVHTALRLLLNLNKNILMLVLAIIPK